VPLNIRSKHLNVVISMERKQPPLWLKIVMYGGGSLFLLLTYIAFMFPGLLQKLNLTPLMGKVIVLQIGALVLLLSALAKELGTPARIGFLLGSFILLIEAIMLFNF